MKRFHVHVGVGNLEEAVRFYSKLFGAQPSVRKPDYAKWMIDDPRLNFAISSRATQGVSHLGVQLDSDDEFGAMHAQLADAQAGVVEEFGASCCYAKSDKVWVTDPAGIAWEMFRTHGALDTFDGGETSACGNATACCASELTAAVCSAGDAQTTRAACCS